MRIWIDTEFNGFKSDLISMALVSEDEREFYEVLDCPYPIPWVAGNVIPALNKAPIDMTQFRDKLATYLRQFESCHIIADWPEDIAHLCNVMVTKTGFMFVTPFMTMELNKHIRGDSAIPHNALEDARANRIAHLSLLNQNPAV